MTENLLDGNEDNIVIDENKDYLSELVGEGRKFKNEQELAKGKWYADQMIEFKNKQYDQLREDYLKLLESNQSRANIEELLDRLAEKKLQSEPTPNAEDVNNKSQFDPKQIESLVVSRIQEHESAKKEQENFQKIRAKLEERYGTRFKEALRSQIDNLGLTEDFANELARKHPQVFIKTFGLDEKIVSDPFQAPPSSSQRKDRFAPSGGEKRTYSYYEKMRREQPRLYTDPKIQVQMQNDAITLGEDVFYDM